VKKHIKVTLTKNRSEIIELDSPISAEMVGSDKARRLEIRNLEQYELSEGRPC
jgi:hypothetical protein